MSRTDTAVAPARSTDSGLQRACFAELESKHGALLAFWQGGGNLPEADVQSHCDLVYSLVLLGRAGTIDVGAAERFIGLLATRAFPGWSGGEGPALNVHNSAYAFGTLNLLKPVVGDRFGEVLDGRRFKPETIVDLGSGAPRFPAKFTHHNWRVSHWLGGVPSLLLSVGKSGARDAPAAAELAPRVLARTDAMIDPRSGLIRLYKSRLLQRAFRTAYRLRHDPDLGDVGGVAHILWINHATGRPYIAHGAIEEEAGRLFGLHAPFMEAVPYCLDFDVVQIVRTARPKDQPFAAATLERARRMFADIEVFFERGAPPDYTLHKIPGALATHHECALMLGKESGPLGPPLDIIQAAYWI